MNRSLIVVIPDLPENHKADIRKAAERRGFDCLFFDEPSQSLPFLKEAEIVVGTDPVLSQNAPNLRWLCSPFAGTDRFIADDAFANPAAVLTNSSGAYGVTISEHVIMLLTEILRRQPEYQAHMEQREWVRRLPVRSIHGSRVTILGTGDVGQETLRCLRGLSPAQIIGVNRGGRNPDGLFDRIETADRLDGVLPESDLLIITLPGTQDTYRMIGEKQLKLLPDDAVIINVGRGPVIDQHALEAELRAGRLSAGLDVFEEEPVPQDSTLWTCPRLVMTPHVAGDTSLPHTMDRIVELFLGNFENYCSGRPLARQVDRRTGHMIRPDADSETGKSIRYATEADRDFWFSLDRHLSRDEFKRKLRDRMCYVLTQAGRPAAILRYSLFWDSIPFCTMLYVMDGEQRKGLGRMLMEHWEKEMKDRGYGLVMTSTQENEEAQYFYRAIGYTDCGELNLPFPGYEQPTELIMGKALARPGSQPD